MGLRFALATTSCPCVTFSGEKKAAFHRLVLGCCLHPLGSGGFDVERGLDMRGIFGNGCFESSRRSFGNCRSLGDCVFSGDSRDDNSRSCLSIVSVEGFTIRPDPWCRIRVTDGVEEVNIVS